MLFTETRFFLFFAIVFGLWALSRPDMDIAEWVVLLLALCFFLNGLFSRCYLWYFLDLNTYDESQKNSDRAAC